MRLKLERFGLPNKPSGTPAHRRWVGAQAKVGRCAGEGQSLSPANA